MALERISNSLDARATISDACISSPSCSNGALYIAVANRQRPTHARRRVNVALSSQLKYTEVAAQFSSTADKTSSRVPAVMLAASKSACSSLMMLGLKLSD